MPLSGQQQDCNTQNVQGVYSNTVVLQHHNVVLTKADKVSERVASQPAHLLFFVCFGRFFVRFFLV